MSEIEIRTYSALEKDRWDDFVLNQTIGTIFHTSLWLSQFSTGFPTILIIQKEDRLVAGFPFIVNSKLGLKRILQPPLTPYFSPVFADSLSVEEKSRYFYALIDHLSNPDILQLTFPPENDEYQDYSAFPSFEITDHPTNIISSDKKPEDLLGDYKKSLRYEVRKAGRNGLKVKHNIPWQKVRIMAEKSLRHASKTFPLTSPHYLQLCEHLDKENRIHSLGVFDADDRCLAAQLLVTDHRMAYNLLFGIDRNYSKLNAGPLLMHHAIKWALEVGLNFDFEGSSIPGVNRFFQKFNPVEYNLKTMTSPPSRKLVWLNKLVNIFGKKLY